MIILKLYIDWNSSKLMSKLDLINTVGKLFVDEQFRSDYFNNLDQVLNSIQGLSDKEKQFLRDNNDSIHEAITAMNIRYSGEDKSH